MAYLVFVLGLLVASCAMEAVETATPGCTDAAATAGWHRHAFGEAEVKRQRMPSGDTAVLFANPRTGSWSLFVETPRHPGLLCLVRAGHGYREPQA